MSTACKKKKKKKKRSDIGRRKEKLQAYAVKFDVDSNKDKVLCIRVSI